MSILRRCTFAALGLLVAGATLFPSRLMAAGSDPPNLAKAWDFKFKKFVIGAWWGPGATDAEIKLYREAGFNVVMSGRYMELDGYGDANRGLHELDLARKYGLGVLFDTYTQNTRPWGGKAGPTDKHPFHHPASLIELQWLYKKLGHNPALIGFMIGDDQGSVSQRAADCTQFLLSQPAPRLMPWLCGWIDPADLARHDNPIEDPQIYPSLYQWDLPAEEQARQYCINYSGMSRQCAALGLLFWPMFNVSRDTGGKADAPGYIPSDSLTRFPAYAAVAYGAEGIWYFIYNGGAIEKQGVYHSEKEARAALTPLYPIAKEVNHRIAAWGPRLLGRQCAGLFGTAFRPAVEWPFPGEAPAAESREGLSNPGRGKLVQAMSDNLLAGVLTRRGRSPLLMIVDCRASKSMGDLPRRRVTVQLNPAVSSVEVLQPGGSTTEDSSTVSLDLPAGGGQLVELHGSRLEALCTQAAIQGAAAPARTASPERTLSRGDLQQIRAARLRIDVFGADSRPQYAAKYIDLNGHLLAQVPSNDTDSWSVRVVALTPEQLSWVQRDNTIMVRTECDDAWKFRNLSLAVQLADGSWVRTPIDPTAHSSPHWAYSEGDSWGTDGKAGPISLEFRSASP